MNMCPIKLQEFIPSISLTKVTRQEHLFPESQDWDAAQTAPEVSPKVTPPLNLPLTSKSETGVHSSIADSL